MRVLHVIPAIAHRYGGPSFGIRALCKAQSQQNGVEPEIATTDADGPSRTLEDRDVPKDCPVHLFRRTWSERWKYSFGLGRWLNQNVKRFDIVHVHAVWSHSTRAAASAARKAGIPYLVRPAGMLSAWSFSNRSLLKSVFWSLGERSCMQSATGFHATSEEEATEIRNLIPNAWVNVISNGVSDEAWSTRVNGESRVPLQGLPDDGLPVVVFLSRLHPKKGVVDLLLPAFAAISVPARLVIAGGADEHAPEYLEEIRRAINRLGLNDRVIMMGAVESSQRWAFLDAADVFVLPSHSENFGIVVAEAMARGRSVIVTNAVQSWTHVQAAGAGIVVPVTVEGVRGALEEVLREPEKRRRMGEAGRDYAKTHFSWDGIATQVSEMYSAAIKPKEAM